MMAAFGATAHAGVGVPPKGVEKYAHDREAAATAVYASVLKAVQAGKTATFADADGKSHKIAVVNNNIILDGKTVKPSSSSAAAPAESSADPSSEVHTESNFLCKFKVAAALSAILALGAIAIGFFVAPLAATTSVALAGVTLTVSTWNAIAAAIGSVSTILGFLDSVLC
jgi:hypothetical protein